MKRLGLPSLVQIGRALGEVLRRFPWTVFMAAAGVGAAITRVEMDGVRGAADWAATSVILTALVGLPLTLAVEVFAEAREFLPDRRRVAELASLALALLYYFSLPADWRDVTGEVYLRTALVVLGLHFLVSVAPFAGRRPETEFWDFNWRVFLRFWLGALYSAVLYVGLAAAVASASRLFGFEIKGERYAELWLVVVGLFNTCFVLHGVPRMRGAAPAETVYPRGLRMFAQFALAPLVVVYLAILYPYAAKIFWLGAWPNGWVALPILCLAVAGVLAALLLHPIRDDPEERWAAWYWRWFFRALFPLTVLLYLAVRVRVRDYGVTEPRYFGFVLAGWLAWTSAYFWWQANRSIRWLPASLACLCLLTTWGPWGAFQVSEWSQLARLKHTLAARGWIGDGVLKPKKQELPGTEYRDLQSELRYLLGHRSAGLEQLLAPYRARKTSIVRAGPGWRAREAEAPDILAWLGVKSAGMPSVHHGFSVAVDSGPGAIAGYSRAGVVFDLNRYGRPTAETPGWPRFELDRGTGRLRAITPAGRTDLPAVNAMLAAAAKAAAPQRLPWAKLTATATIDGRDYRIVVLRAMGRVGAGGRAEVSNLTLLVLER